MTKRMLVDATHPEETRVAIVESYRDNNRLEDLDFSLASKPILRGNIYLAKVMRIEPSLQAAFVEYGGNRHGFLPFGEIHPDYFRIPVADRPHDDDASLDAADEDGEEGSDQNDVLDDEGGEDAAYDGDTPESALPAVMAQEDEDRTTVPAPDAEREESFPAAAPPSPFPHALGDVEGEVGLITDFGNAAVGGSLTEVAMSEAPPESVGGEELAAERAPRRHRPRYKIQEVLKRGQVMLIQVVKEERGNKGAALTTYLSLAGRYCVLMPNTDHGGGVSRKITNHQDRRRMKETLDQLDIPEGMAVILRTAGMEQAPPDIQRDLEYLLSMWDSIREQTLQSSAPALIYEEANLIKRSIRDLYAQDIAEILVAGEDGFNRSRDFLRAIMPDQAEKIKLYNHETPLFIRYQVENQIDMLHNPIVQLRSGGYLVINPTEALVSIDVNSGRATRERHIEETALKTNLEAAEEIARQLRLRDLAGLVVIDFIDMEDGRNNAAVERRLKDAMKNDRARLQIGRISPFGLLELSRQRLRPSLVEISFEKCPHCSGTGYIRSADSAALSILRAVEEEALKQRSSAMTVQMPMAVAVYILNNKRAVLTALEERYGIAVSVQTDESLPPPGYKVERVKGKPSGMRRASPAVDADQVIADTEREMPQFSPAPASLEGEGGEEAGDVPFERADLPPSEEQDSGSFSSRKGRGGRFRRHDRGARQKRGREREHEREPATAEGPVDAGESAPQPYDAQGNDQDGNRRRRRGRRGGRGRHGDGRSAPAGGWTVRADAGDAFDTTPNHPADDDRTGCALSPYGVRGRQPSVRRSAQGRLVAAPDRAGVGEEGDPAIPSTTHSERQG